MPRLQKYFRIRKLSERFGLSFIISVSRNEEDLPEAVKGMIETSL